MTHEQKIKALINEHFSPAEYLPQNEETYWCVLLDGTCDWFYWCATNKDNLYRYNTGNCFRTHGEAKAYAEKIKALFRAPSEEVEG